MDKPLFSERIITDYEVRASWWTKYIGWKWAQSLTASYFAWKIRKKYGRWQESLRIKEELLHKK